MALFYTADPARDALDHDDSIERQCEINEIEKIAEQSRLAYCFVSAAELGSNEPLEGITVGEAIYEVSQNQPGLIDAFFYRAATQTKDPVLRAMVREVGDAWAEIKQREQAK